MAKKKKRSGGGGGGEQQKPAAEEDIQEHHHHQQQQGGEDHDTATSSADAQLKSTAAAEEGKENKENAKDGKEGNKEKEKKVLPVVTAVLKVDMHCDGCAKRIRASIRHYPGVEGVAMAVEKGTMTVVGRFDANKLRDRVATKTKKKVDLVTGNNNKNKGGGGGGGGNNNKGKENGKAEQEDGDEKGKDQQDHDEKNKGKDDNNKANSGGGGDKEKGGNKDSKNPVVPVVGTVVLKIGGVGLHCDGCMHRIRSKLFHIDGVEQVSMELGKNQVTVTGTMDIKTLPKKLRKKMGRPVDVVQPNNNKQKQQDGKDGNKQDGKDAAAKALAAEKDAWMAEFYDQQSLLATEYMLSDENPNACTIT